MEAAWDTQNDKRRRECSVYAMIEQTDSTSPGANEVLHLETVRKAPGKMKLKPVQLV